MYNAVVVSNSKFNNLVMILVHVDCNLNRSLLPIAYGCYGYKAEPITIMFLIAGGTI
jgi:hypothetical protein